MATTERWAGVLVAVAMAGCSALHITAAARDEPRSGVHVLVMLAMALPCLPCAVHAVLAPARRVWIRTVAVAIGMLAAHWLLGVVQLSDLHVMTMPMAGSGVLSTGLLVGPILTAALAGLALVAGGRKPAAEGRHV